MTARTPTAGREVVADEGPRRSRRVEKPWGHELIWAETATYAAKILHIEAQGQLSYQYHEQKSETIYVLEGVLELEIGTPAARRTLRLERGQGFHLPAGLRHRMTAIETCDILEASTPELDDIIRLEDRYGRTGG